MTKSIEESDQQSHVPQTDMSTAPYAKQTTHDLPGELVGGIDSNVDTVFRQKEGWLPQIAKVNAISSGKDVNDKMLIEDGPDHEDLPFQNSSPLDIGCSGSNNGDRSMSDSAILTENDEAAKATINRSKISRLETKNWYQAATAIEKEVSVNAYDAQHGSKLLIAPVLIDKETKVSPVIPGREGSDSYGSEQIKYLKDLSIQESPSSSTEKPRIPSRQSVNPKLMLLSAEPMRNSKIITAGGNKLCPDKQPAQKKTDISTWKISRYDAFIIDSLFQNIGGNKSSLNDAPQKQVKSQRSSEQNKELDGNVELKTAQIVDRSLASLNPLKRLSLSPRETRNFKEPSKGAVEEQVGMHENHLESNTKSPTSSLGSPCMVYIMELEIPSAMETDENVEKAGAYTKELEDICNMLKKKHEEAKEILVRAVVKNNNLLMLNHPIYEAKNIHEVQKFAANWHPRSFKHVEEWGHIKAFSYAMEQVTLHVFCFG
ncbi:hypothetical protein M0R45_014082 [Rubus argutus]|uniref:Uncharacterized protein n=1 Tax=Rubus argutus TaxID=59490 RepID=A0AAW1XLR8_RUBAR